MSSAGRDALVAMLSRLKTDLSQVNLAKADQARDTLKSKYPLSGDYLAEVRRICEQGMDDGWLCPAAADDQRHSRLAGTSSRFPFSIDAQLLSGSSEAHAHPKGEVGLFWSVSGRPSYCEEKDGWLVFAPGSKHLPEVVGGKMFVLSFRPEGAVETGVRVPVKRKAKTKAKTTRSVASRRTKRASAAS